jgi:hypothetical protein
VSTLKKFAGLGWQDRFLLIEASLYLAVTRLALLIVPFRFIARLLGRQFPPERQLKRDAPSHPDARRVAWAVELISRRTPWESACLPQSIAAKLMLGRRGVPTLLYLGTRKDPGGHLAAHAWLRSGAEIVLGGGAAGTFTPLSAFGDPPA